MRSLVAGLLCYLAHEGWYSASALLEAHGSCTNGADAESCSAAESAQTGSRAALPVSAAAAPFADGGLCECEVRTVNYADPGAAAVLTEHLKRNIPLRVVGVPQSEQPELSDAKLREVAGHRTVELRAIGAQGFVPKGSERVNATFAEVLADGGKLAADWYAAQLSVPDDLPELLPMLVTPDIGSSWADGVGKATKGSPYIYYYGGKTDVSNSPGPALYIHYDAVENFIQVVDGWKEFSLYDPFQAASILYGDNDKYGNASPVNPDSPNVTTDFPLFRFASPRRCVVKRGEWIYLPLFWWHRVKNGMGRTVSVVHFHRSDKDKKGFFDKIMCGYSMRPAAFECSSGKRR